MSYTELINRRATNEASDECYTPEDQILPLLKYLDKDKTYYEATSGKSSSIVSDSTNMVIILLGLMIGISLIVHGMMSMMAL